MHPDSQSTPSVDEVPELQRRPNRYPLWFENPPTLLLLEASWAFQVLYCSLPSTRMGSPFFL